MFQFAFGLLASQKFRTIFLPDTNFYKYDLGIFRLKFPYNLLRYVGLFRVYNFLQKRWTGLNIIDATDCSTDQTQIPIVNEAYYYGYFQDPRLYERHKQELLKLFTVRRYYTKQFGEKYKRLLEGGKRLVVISVRRGDYEGFIIQGINKSVLIPIDWYERNLSNIVRQNDELLIVTDDPNQVEQEWNNEKYPATIVRGSVAEQLLLMHHADILLISNSTFAWWGAYLNVKQATVYAPSNFLGFNHGFEYPAGIHYSKFNWMP